MRCNIPFNKPLFLKNSFKYIENLIQLQTLGEEGEYYKYCREWINKNHKSLNSIITHSCTGSLEIAALLSNIKKGDEVILPSYTFLSSASAFVLRGAKLVFAEINEKDLNIDAEEIIPLISNKTKAIIVVHYAGVSCDMEKILKISQEYNITVIEDSAQAILSQYKNKPCGSLGDLGCISFHETKNIHCGKGGALLINKRELINRAEIIASKGTNRNDFLKGKVDKYSWVDIGSSYKSSELNCGFLGSQLDIAKSIIKERLELWHYYFQSFSNIDNASKFSLPSIPNYAKHNGHIFYIILKNYKKRKSFISELRENGIETCFHYVPLHSSSYGKKMSSKEYYLPITDKISASIVRFPLWHGLQKSDIDFISLVVEKILNRI